MEQYSIKYFKDALDQISEGPGDITKAVNFLKYTIPATETNYYKVMSLLKSELPTLKKGDATRAIETAFPHTAFDETIKAYVVNKLKDLPPTATLAASVAAIGSVAYVMKQAYDATTSAIGNAADFVSDAGSSVSNMAHSALNMLPDAPSQSSASIPVKISAEKRAELTQQRQKLLQYGNRSPKAKAAVEKIDRLLRNQ